MPRQDDSFNDCQQPAPVARLLALPAVLDAKYAANKMIPTQATAVRIYGAGCLSFTAEAAVVLADRVWKRKVELINVEPGLHAALTRLLQVRRDLWS